MSKIERINFVLALCMAGFALGCAAVSLYRGDTTLGFWQVSTGMWAALVALQISLSQRLTTARVELARAQGAVDALRDVNERIRGHIPPARPPIGPEPISDDDLQRLGVRPLKERT